MLLLEEKLSVIYHTTAATLKQIMLFLNELYKWHSLEEVERRKLVLSFTNVVYALDSVKWCVCNFK